MSRNSTLDIGYFQYTLQEMKWRLNLDETKEVGEKEAKEYDVYF